jgi:hypothetical protein
MPTAANTETTVAVPTVEQVPEEHSMASRPVAGGTTVKWRCDPPAHRVRSDRLQYKVSTARTAGSDPLFRIVKISEEVEEGMQLPAEVVEAGRWDGEQADALFIEVRCTAGRSPAVRAVRDGASNWLPCRWRG